MAAESPLPAVWMPLPAGFLAGSQPLGTEGARGGGGGSRGAPPPSTAASIQPCSSPQPQRGPSTPRPNRAECSPRAWPCVPAPTEVPAWRGAQKVGENLQSGLWERMPDPALGEGGQAHTERGWGLLPKAQRGSHPGPSATQEECPDLESVLSHQTPASLPSVFLYAPLPPDPTTYASQAPATCQAQAGHRGAETYPPGAIAGL